MAYEPLHHKYRPQTFAELVGQEAITTTLINAIQQGKIAPAYLFTGARGTGKTSSARIMAKSLNCLSSPQPTAQPCGVCEVCRTIANGSALDVIEIDAASNTGVDNIREVIERAQFAPVQCRHKVYVIDECHMLSTSAFNALLKTLEEPPDHVVFVLATTDPQRVLPTIISRCQRFDFRRIPLEAMVGHLGRIAANESIEITTDAVRLIAQIAQGGLRDAESLLDQLSLLPDTVTVEKVWDLVGAVPERDLLALVQAIAADHATSILDRARNLMDRGREPLIVLQNLAGFYRDLLIAKTAPDRADLVALTADTWTELCDLARSLDITTILAGQQHLRTCELQVKNTAQPRLWLEVALMGLLPSAIGAGVGVRSAGVGVRSAGAGVRSADAGVQSAGVGARSGGTTTQESRRAEAIPPSVAPIAPAAHTPHTTPATPHTTPATPHSAPATPHTTPPTPHSALSTPHSAPATPHSAPATPHSAPPHSALRTPHSQLSTPHSAPSSQPDLSQIWQQVMGVIHLLTKGLLSDHGQLLAIHGNEVKIGINAEKLLKPAQGQLKNIETAFKDVLGRDVKVTIVVTAQPEASTETVEPAKPTPISNPYPSAPVITNKVMEASPRIVPAPVTPATAPAKVSTPLAEPDLSQPSAQSPPLPTPEPAYNQDVEDVRRSAKNLAEWFGGIVVDLEQGSDDDRLGAIDAAPWTEPDPDSEDAPF